MRGQPLLRILLTLFLLFLMGLAVWQCTLRRKDSSPVQTAITTQPPAASPVQILLTASQPWEKCTIQFLGHAVLQAKPGESAQTQAVELPVEKSAVDLVVNATWKTQAPHALRIQVMKQDTLLFETTLWGSHTLQEVVTIPSQKP